jgi:hypothetical protein
VRVAQPGEHGGGAEWWLGARARVQGAGLRLPSRLGRGGRSWALTTEVWIPLPIHESVLRIKDSCSDCCSYNL